ncbi:MAG: hypothetical protein QM695_14925 [Micropruina sp.]
MYGRGDNEELLGRHLHGVRERIVLATKTGIVTVPGLGLPTGVDGSPTRIARRHHPTRSGRLPAAAAALEVTLTVEQRNRLDRLKASGDRYRSSSGVPSRR